MKNLITILCLCLFWFSCDSLTETESNEIDVDWVLVKTLNMESMISDSNSSNESIIDDGNDDGGEEGDELNEENDVIGYYFYFTNYDITNLNIEEIPDKFHQNYDCVLDMGTLYSMFDVSMGFKNILLML